MSIASALSDIATNLSTILGQINTKLTAKGVSTAAETLAEVPDKIDTISTGSGVVPTGTKTITTNGTHDVTDYANASVNVPTGTPKTASDITVSGKTVTVPAGLYTAQAQKSVASASQATPSVSVETTNGIVTATSTQSAGYVTSGTTSRTLDLKNVDTSNFNENNIRFGVTIFGKTGNYGGSGDWSDPYVLAGTVSAYRTGGGALVFTLPIGQPVAGFYMECPSATTGLIERLFVLGSESSSEQIVICVRSGYGAANIYYQNGIVSYSVNSTSGSVAVTVDTALTGGFASGQYAIKTFFHR